MAKKQFLDQKSSSKINSQKTLSSLETQFFNTTNYQPVAADFKPVDPKKGEKRQVELIGSRRSTPLEVLRRFTKNKIALFSFFLLIVIVITSLYVFFASVNDPIKQLAFREDLQVDFTANLPSSFYPTITRTYDYFSNSNIINAIETASRLDPNFSYQATPIENSSLVIYTYDSYKMLKAINGGVEYQSILGTNNLGQDVWTRTWFAVLESISLGFFITISETLIGIFVGSYIGFHVGKHLDTFAMRLISIFSSIPDLLWFILLGSLFGTSYFSLYFISIFFGWPGAVSLARTYIIMVKDAEFVNSARSVGAGKFRQVFSHCLPAVLGKIVYAQVVRIPSVVFFVASLAFFNLIKAEESYNLGIIINNARSDFRFNHWVLTFPVLLLLSITLSLKFLAIGFHDALEPPRISLRGGIKGW